MDPGIGDLPTGDLLVSGSTIAQIGPDLSGAAGPDTVVIDASGHILAPGFQDAHRHCWQTQFRRWLPDADLAYYLELMHFGIAPPTRRTTSTRAPGWPRPARSTPA